MTEPIRVFHVITDLDTGGAEMMLYKLLGEMDRSRFCSQVISLMSVGSVGEKIKSLGIEVMSLGIKPGRIDPSGIFKLAALLRSSRADLVQTWMYHADLFGGIAAFLAGRIPTLWNIRNSDLDPKTSKRSTRLLVRLNAFLSFWLPRKVLVCSRRAMEIHTKAGYARKKMILAPNGFNLSEFRPDPEARQRLLAELGLEGEPFIVGLAARFDPQKDIATFIAAAEIVAAEIPETRFILCGEGMTVKNAELAAWIESAGLKQKTYTLGRRDDMPNVTAAFDLAVSSSAYGEAFSNAIGEAMACGAPCVATDVGDSVSIIADTGRAVPPRDPQKLAGAIVEILRMPTKERERLGQAARERIRTNFDLKIVAKMYMDIYEEVTK